MLRKPHILYTVLVIGVVLLIADYRWISTEYHPKHNGVPIIQGDRLDRLTLVRFPEMDDQAAPTGYQVTDPDMIKQVYSLMLKLSPTEWDRVYHCPGDSGEEYIIKFESDHTVKMTATASEGGCRFISFDNGMSVISNNSFWQLVKQVISEEDNRLTMVPLSSAASYT